MGIPVISESSDTSGLQNFLRETKTEKLMRQNKNMSRCHKKLSEQWRSYIIIIGPLKVVCGGWGWGGGKHSNGMTK